MALKYSRQRESIKANLMHRTDHPTADMVYADIRKVFPNISLGTVYRNLALLSDLGEIHKLAPQGGAERYDGNTRAHNHFVCRACGCVQDMEGRESDLLTERANRQFSGRIDDCSVTFYGMCKECLEKLDGEKQP
ncbi:MAG: transcriptional repressor [Eubacterium sp.]|nr:transcriptional repressor [Eubacterium sp.]